MKHGEIVLATTTYNTDIFPFMREFVNHLVERGYQNRTIGIIENGSWAPMAAKVIKKTMEPCKNITWAENTVSIRSALNEQSEAKIEALADELLK